MEKKNSTENSKSLSLSIKRVRTSVRAGAQALELDGSVGIICFPPCSSGNGGRCTTFRSR